MQQTGHAIHFQPHAQVVFDVTGAGDTVIATLAAAICGGMGWAQAVRLANTAAGLVVTKVGTSVVSLAELNRELNGGCVTSGLQEKSHVLQGIQQAKQVIFWSWQ